MYYARTRDGLLEKQCVPACVRAYASRGRAKAQELRRRKQTAGNNAGWAKITPAMKPGTGGRIAADPAKILSNAFAGDLSSVLWSLRNRKERERRRNVEYWRKSEKARS